MATLNLMVSRDIKDWIDSRVEKGEFATADEYLSELVERDRDSRSDEERIEALRRVVEEAERGGISNRTAAERIAEGNRRLREQGRG